MLLKTLYAAGTIGLGLAPVSGLPPQIAAHVPAAVRDSGEYAGQAAYLDAGKLPADQLVTLTREVQDLCEVAPAGATEKVEAFRDRVRAKGIDYTQGGILIYGPCIEEVFGALKDVKWGGAK